TTTGTRKSPASTGIAKWNWRRFSSSRTRPERPDETDKSNFKIHPRPRHRSSPALVPASAPRTRPNARRVLGRGRLVRGAGDGVADRRGTVKVSINVNSLDDYRLFLKIKALPTYRICGRVAEFPDEYAHLLKSSVPAASDVQYKPLACLLDYQAAISEMAIRKRKFAVFADCGLGKTLIMTEFARHAADVMPAEK